MTEQEFIEKIAGYVQKYAPLYGIRVHSPIIAQAILESNWGKSRLASVYHNYHGMKCGSKWTGKSVNMKTNEEYQTGTLTTIKDNFRVYESMEEGVKGYFEFIQLKRYNNLKGITDARLYLETIKADGYATSSKYVENNMRVVEQYHLTQYDRKDDEDMGKYASKVVEQAQAWIGRKESDGTHKEIIDLYNSHKPLARSYKVKYTDSWCATFVSAVAIKLGYTKIIPTECSCQNMIGLFKIMGCWIENENRTPNAGDIIFYDWQDSGFGDNKGWSDHVGIVEKVANGTITIIEGNYNNSVKRRTLAVNGKFIRGYGVPRYDAEANGTTTPSGSTTSKKAKSSAKSYEPYLAGTYEVTASGLHVREGAGTNHASMVVIPKGTKVKCYGYYTQVNGTKWLYVQFTFKGVQYTGFASSKYLKE